MCRWMSAFQNNFALQTSTWKPAKFSVPILQPLSINKCTVKDSFHFVTEIVEQDSSNFVDSLDIDFLLTSFRKKSLKKFTAIIF